MVAVPRMKGAPVKKTGDKKKTAPKAQQQQQNRPHPGGRVYDSGSEGSGSDDMNEDKVQINTVSSGKVPKSKAAPPAKKRKEPQEPASKKAKVADDKAKATKQGDKDKGKDKGKGKGKDTKGKESKAGGKRKDRGDSDDEEDKEAARQKNINDDGTAPLTNFDISTETIAKLEAGGIKSLFPVRPSHPACPLVHRL